MPKWVARYYQPLLILVFGGLYWSFCQFAYPHHFFFQEQNQLFLFDTDHLCTYFESPAWLSRLAGDFITQFYYYLWTGPLLLTLILFILGDLLRRALQRVSWKRAAFWVALAAMIVFAFFHLHHRYRLPSTISFIGGTCAYIVYSWLCQHVLKTKKYSRIIKTLLLAVITLITYHMMGYGWMVMLVLVFLEGISKRTWSIIEVSVSIVLLLACVMGYTNERYTLTTTDNLLYPGMGKWCKPEMLLEKSLAVDDAYYFGDYKKVTELVESSGEQTQEMLFFYNLVKAQQGELPDVLLRYQPNILGTFYEIGPTTPLITIRNMNELYWAIGDLTFTERAAMMAHVFTPGNRNARMLKRLAECNIAAEDSIAAQKYLRILGKTLAYRKWAKRIEDREEAALRPILEKRHWMHTNDTIRLGDNAHRILLQLLDAHPDNIVALDYILCSDLLLKDIGNFKRDYDRFCHSQGKPRRKPIYQQALMIWLTGKQAPQETWQQYITDTELTKRFMAYNNHRGSNEFRDTYWYYFDKADISAILPKSSAQ